MSGIIRRSFALVSIPVLVVVGLYVLLARGTPWRGEWLWTLDWATGTSAILAPLTAGVAAFEARRWHDAQRLLLDSTERRRLAALLPAGLGFLSGALSLLVVVVVAVVLTLSAGGTPTSDLRLPLLGLVAIGAAAALGAVLGNIAPSILTAPLAAALVFALALVAGLTSVPAVFRVGGTTGTLAGLTTPGRFVVLIGGAGLLLALTCLLALVRRPGDSAVALIVASVVTAVVGVYAWADPPQQLVTDPSPDPLHCSETRPVVCLSSATDRLLAALPSQLARASRPLERAGVRPPSRFTQVLPGRRVRVGAPLYLESYEVNRPRLEADAVLRALVVPASCPQDTGTPGPPEDVFAARSTVTAWLAIQTGEASARQFRGQPDASWLARPTSEQTSWLRTTYADLTDCDLDAVTAAPGTGSANGS